MNIDCTVCKVTELRSNDKCISTDRHRSTDLSGLQLVIDAVFRILSPAHHPIDRHHLQHEVVQLQIAHIDRIDGHVGRRSRSINTEIFQSVYHQRLDPREGEFIATDRQVAGANSGIARSILPIRSISIASDSEFISASATVSTAIKREINFGVRNTSKEPHSIT